jgi:hypothetical protein
MVARHPSEEAWELAFGSAVDTIEACCSGDPDPACWD